MMVTAILRHKGHEVVSVHPTATISNVAQLLSERRIGAAVVRVGALVREWTAIRAFILVPPVTSSEQRLAYPNSSFD